MRSRTERALWTALAVALAAGAGAAWWTADQWGPHAGPWARQAWRKITRPGPETLPPHAGAAARGRAAVPSAQAAASTPARPPRKCVRDGRTTYTDQPCLPGSQEQAVEGGAVMSLPPN
jgi:hypothetical protein